MKLRLLLSAPYLYGRLTCNMSILPNIMRVKLVLFALMCFVLWEALRAVPSVASSGAALGRVEKQLEPVKVAVYYESLCPDSRAFIITQLLPTAEKIPNLVDITLVPYGKATTNLTNTGYEFVCQHGPIECQGNKVHACAIKRVTDQLTIVRYITCMITDNLDPEAIGQSCASQYNIDWDPILECSRGLEGQTLLSDNGLSTAALDPILSFVPTITLNESQDNQVNILKDLLTEVCSKYPDPKPTGCV